MNNKELLKKIVTISKEAGDAILEVYNNESLLVETKEDNSPLTLADIASHKVICEGLKSLDINYPILSEEGALIPYEERKHWDRYWLIDPLDGTKEFIKRNGEFTVNIALIENDTPILGVVYSPVLKVCYYGEKDSGSFKEDSLGNILAIFTNIEKKNGEYSVVASRSHRDEKTDALLQKLGEHTCVSMGSSLKLCLVAEGAANLYPRLAPTMEWDTAAAHAVVSGAGGVVLDTEGNNLVYNKENLLNPHFIVLSENDTDLKTIIWKF